MFPEWFPFARQALIQGYEHSCRVRSKCVLPVSRENRVGLFADGRAHFLSGLLQLLLWVQLSLDYRCSYWEENTDNEFRSPQMRLFCLRLYEFFTGCLLLVQVARSPLNRQDSDLKSIAR